MRLMLCDDTTGEFKVFSSKTGELVYDAIMRDNVLQREIVDAIRKAEKIAFNHAINRAIEKLEPMEG